MRRYAVRFLVAILTFALGVALSMVLGLFRPQEIRFAETTWSKRPPCPKKFRVARPAFLTIDTEFNDPLNLVYLGETPDRRMKFLVENRRDQSISGFSIKGNEIWGTDGTTGRTLFEWSSDDFLGPRESRSVTTVVRGPEGLSLRINRVTFQSGFNWVNPREPR